MGVDGSDWSAGRGVPTGHDADDLLGTISWREVLTETVARMEAAGLPRMEARWMVEEASGLDAADDLAGLRADLASLVSEMKVVEVPPEEQPEAEDDGP